MPAKVSTNSEVSAIRHAAHPQTLHHEFFPAPLNPSLRIRADHRAREHGVEPVHRKPRLGHVEQVRLGADRVAELVQCRLPFGALPPEDVREGQRALDAHVNRT
jgi:hypothetical protein